MGLIPVNQARGLFTQDLIKVYKQLPKPTDFLKKFFPEKTSNTRYLYWAVRREGEPVAVDVVRGTEGNRNTFSIETDKIVDPPYFNENFDITQTDLYYRAFSSDMVDESVMTDYMTWVLEHMQSITNKIERAYELQRITCLLTGVITLKDGSVIDFKRNALSIVDNGGASYWDTNATTIDPIAILDQGCTYLRTAGKASGGNFNVIMGEKALEAFLNTTAVKSRGRDFYMKLSDLQMPNLDTASGAAYHGRISVGSYTCDIWTYPQYYDAIGQGPVGNSVAYMNPKQIIVIPQAPDFIMGYAAVPILPMSTTGRMSLPTLTKGAYTPYDRINQMNDSWVAGVKSAGIALPTAIDQIFTATVTAA